MRELVASEMRTDRAEQLRAEAAECLMLASTSTDSVVAQAMREQAEALLRMAARAEAVAKAHDEGADRQGSGGNRADKPPEKKCDIP